MAVSSGADLFKVSKVTCVRAHDTLQLKGAWKGGGRAGKDTDYKA